MSVEGREQQGSSTEGKEGSPTRGREGASSLQKELAPRARANMEACGGGRTRRKSWGERARLEDESF